MQRIASIRSPSIGEVRGRGFMIGVELVHGDRPMDSKKMMRIKARDVKARSNDAHVWSLWECLPLHGLVEHSA